MCTLLCIGATLDDIDYINAIRAPRTMNANRGTSIADDDTDDQHTHFLLAPICNAVDFSAPFLSALYAVAPQEPPVHLAVFGTIRAGRAPPSTAAA